MMIEIKKMLSQKESVHRKELLDHLLATKIMGNETAPMQALAIFLSRNKADFQSTEAETFHSVSRKRFGLRPRPWPDFVRCGGVHAPG